MIGKVIVWAEDRDRAIKKMRRAMDEFEIGGVKTVIDFHRRMMRNPDFIENRFDTKYLESHM